MHTRERLNDDEKGDLPIPVDTPPFPARTQTLKTAVMASQMRYQVLTSAFPVVKVLATHLLSAKPIEGALVSIPHCDVEDGNEVDTNDGDSKLENRTGSRKMPDSAHLHESMATGNPCCTPGKPRGPNTKRFPLAGMSPRMSRQELHSGPNAPRHCTVGLKMLRLSARLLSPPWGSGRVHQ